MTLQGALQFEDLQDDEGYEHEVLIAEENGVQLSEKSLTDNSKVYNVIITKENKVPLIEYSPRNLQDARSLFDHLVKEGPGDYMGSDE